MNHEILGRVGGIAVVDVVATAAVAVYLGKDSMSRLNWFVGLVALGEVAHVVFKKETPITRLLTQP